jgi:hypothetical protein
MMFLMLLSLCFVIEFQNSNCDKLETGVSQSHLLALLVLLDYINYTFSPPGSTELRNTLTLIQSHST